ncbi:hypothetical protein LOZ65_001711 [Ophidiomyces ophidiicola]|nr:hypothetical protein LOZ65_001711 [Ophidiomyces ophidiicola]
MYMVLTPIFDSRVCISVLEIGPGPRSVLGYLPGHMRLKIKRYTAFEPNLLFATMMEKWLRPDLPMESPFPSLQGFHIIHQEPFSMHEGRKTHIASSTGGPDEKHDVILFCHSMYGLNPKPKFIERALEMLVKQPEGMVLVFHRDGNPSFDELVCHQTTSFPIGEICVLNDDSSLDGFASFIVGFKFQDREAGDEKKGSSPDRIPLVMAEAGCKAGDIIRKTMEAGLTVPLGARPSVGAGLWLQGGIGHLSRLYGLACDAIVGAVVISVKSSQVFCIGHVPTQHWPTGAVRPKNEMDLLWALRGAGTNIGIVVSVAFKAFAAPTYLVRKWIVPSTDSHDAQLMISNFERVAKKLPQNCSVDAYLYCEAGEMRLGITMFETSTPSYDSRPLQPTPIPPNTFLGPEDSLEYMDGVEVFDAEMYVSEIHGGHGGSKTPRSSDYHCCRDWNYAYVVTGVWLRDLDGTTIAQDVVQWVYNVVNSLLPLSCGTYSADLGPDPRDMSLSVKAFAPNRQRLAKLKHVVDPFNVLKYTCPLPRAMAAQKLIILVTGESCAGKDYCADVWVSVLMRNTHERLTARAVSISDVTKREYSEATGANLKRLLSDRVYKEQHRSALTTFFQRQVQQQYQLPEQRFLDVVHHATDVEVLPITRMRDEAPVATFSHLVPASRLLEVHVRASGKTRGVRRSGTEIGYNACDKNTKDSNHGLADLNHRPEFIFDNETDGKKAADSFAQKYLFPFLHEDLE